MSVTLAAQIIIKIMQINQLYNAVVFYTPDVKPADEGLDWSPLAQVTVIKDSAYQAHPTTQACSFIIAQDTLPETLPMPLELQNFDRRRDFVRSECCNWFDSHGAYFGRK